MSASRWVPAGEGGPAGHAATPDAVVAEPVPLHLRDWAWRRRLRSLPGVGHLYKLLVGLVGLFVVVVGLIMVPFPGPGWAVVFVGLFILATEFPHASRLLFWVRGKVVAFGHWLKRQGWGVRLGMLAVTSLTATAIVWCVAFVVGLPPGLPSAWGDLLTQWAGLPREPLWKR